MQIVGADNPQRMAGFALFRGEGPLNAVHAGGHHVVSDIRGCNHHPAGLEDCECPGRITLDVEELSWSRGDFGGVGAVCTLCLHGQKELW